MLKESMSTFPSTHKLFDQQVTVGIDDIVIYQQKYESGFKSWFYGIQIPKWMYHQGPSELLMKRGISPNILLKEIVDINYLSNRSFNASYSKWQRFSKLISLIAIIFFLILMAIPSSGARIFFGIMVFGIIIGNVINDKFIKPTENAINAALKKVVERVQDRLNLRYKNKDIRFEIAERTTIIHHEGCFCQDTEHQYCHITVRCVDNTIESYLNQDNEAIEVFQVATTEPMVNSNKIGSENENKTHPQRPDTPYPTNENARNNKTTAKTLPQLTESHETLIEEEDEEQRSSIESDKSEVVFPAVNHHQVVIHEISDDEDEFHDVEEFREEPENDNNAKKSRPDTPFPISTNIPNQNKINHDVLPEITESQQENMEEDELEQLQQNNDKKKNGKNKKVNNHESMGTMQPISECKEVNTINNDKKKKQRKDYQYNWAQNVGRRRESWTDPYAAAKRADLFR